MFHKIVNKKVIIRIMMIACIFLSVIVMPQAASKNLSYKWINGWQHEKGSIWGQATKLYLNNEIAFCIDSRYAAKKGSNEVVSLKQLHMTQKQMDTLALIAWYGYRSQSHTDTNYALTQNIIWQYLKKDDHQFVSSSYPYHGKKMQEVYKQVMDKVNHFHDHPSFHSTTFTQKAKETKVYVDKNKVLSGLRIKAVSGGKAQIVNNELHVTPDGTKAEMQVTFDRGMSPEQTKTNFIVRGGGVDANGRPWQAVTPLTGQDPYFSNVKIKVLRDGELQIHKKSLNPSIHENNLMYSLEHAEYGIYKDKDTKTLVATLKTDQNGVTNKVKLEEGMYYVKEIKAPEGFLLTESIVPVNIQAGKSIVLDTKELYDEPMFVVPELLIQKQANVKDSVVPSLQDAQFEVRYYNQHFPFADDPALHGMTPTRTWILKSDDQGYVTMDDVHFVSGDPWYLNAKQVAGLPLGTITVKETKAPNGYNLNTDVFVQKVSKEDVSIHQLQPIVVLDNRIDIEIYKQRKDTNEPLSNVAFIHKQPDGTQTIVRTDQNGKIVLKGLTFGFHKLSEVQEDNGLQALSKPFYFDVQADGTIYDRTSGNDGYYVFDHIASIPKYVILNDLKTYELRIIKENIEGKLLDGAEFTLYKDQACSKAIATSVSKQGIVSFTGLKDQVQYYVKETKAPDGYVLSDQVYEVYAQQPMNTKTFKCRINGVFYEQTNLKDGVEIEQGATGNSVSLHVVNHQHIQLPLTGSNKKAACMIMGISCICMAVLKKKGKNYV